MAKSEWWSIDRLKPWERNPRDIKPERYEELKSRLKRLGQIKPLLVTEDGTVIGGNMRLKAMQEMAWAEVWVSVVDAKTDREIFDLALTDNEEFGYYEQKDLAALALELNLTPLELKSYALNLGAPTTLDLVVNKFGPEVEEDEAPAVDESNVVSKLGEIYRLGKHRLMCGDSTDKASVELLMNGAKVDMVFTDPPYGMDLDTDYSKLKGTDKSPNAKGYKWDAVIGDDREFDFRQFSYLEAKEQFWWGADYYFNQLPNNGGLFVWQKRDKADEKMIGNDFEICWSKQRHKKATIWKRWVGFDSIERGERRVHPTQKPIEVCSYFVSNFNDGEGVILDLFLGSGSTLIACEQTDRTCYGMELDPKYCDVIRKRYTKLIDDNWEETWQQQTPSIQVAALPS